MKTKIIGIALAVIMVASIFGAMAPLTVARDATGRVGGGEVVYRTASTSERGLDISLTGIASGGTFYGIKDSTADGGLMTVADNTNFNVPISAKIGPYNKSSREGTVADIIVDQAEITGNVFINNFKDSIVGGSVPVGTPIQIRASPNFGGILKDGSDYGRLKIKITPPQSTTRENTSFFASTSDLDITKDNWGELDTTNWKTGTATVQITTVKEDCNELDVASPPYTFTVRSEKLKITAKDDEVGQGEKITLTVSGNPSTWYYFAIEDIVKGEELKVEKTASVTPVAGESTNSAKPCAAWVKTGAGGTRDIEVSTAGADERTYTMNVYRGFGTVDWADPDTTKSFTPKDAEDASPKPSEDADVKVQVMESTVTFDIPSKVIIGEDLEIKGAISAGDTVNIIVKDEQVVETNEGVDEDNEFSVKWDTSGMTVGSYTIEVYIDFDEDKYGDADLLGSYASVDPAGKTTIRLIEPGLTAEQPRNVIAEGDDYTLKGTATGVSSVDYFLVGPKGWKANTAPDLLTGIAIGSATVTDDEFEEEETMTDGLDTGLWVAVVLHPGRDGNYETTPLTLGNLGVTAGKSQTQILEIIEDRVTMAGSDDIMKTLSFKVESGYVRLDPIEPVGVGDPLVVTGRSNREPETAITISTFAGPTDLLALTEVEWTDGEYGTFNATIDTTDAKEGTYTLEADDGDGNTDTATVTIGAAAPATPTPVTTPTATPAPTAAPTPVATPTAAPTAAPTPTPEEVPGFGALFAIAGLLAVAYLVLRIKK